MKIYLNKNQVELLFDYMGNNLELQVLKSDYPDGFNDFTNPLDRQKFQFSIKSNQIIEKLFINSVINKMKVKLNKEF